MLKLDFLLTALAIAKELNMNRINTRLIMVTYENGKTNMKKVTSRSPVIFGKCLVLNLGQNTVKLD
jgi:hypothetical protein